MQKTLWPAIVAVLVLIPSVTAVGVKLWKNAHETRLPDAGRRMEAANLLNENLLVRMRKHASEQGILTNGPINVRWQPVPRVPNDTAIDIREPIAVDLRASEDLRGRFAAVRRKLRDLTAPANTGTPGDDTGVRQPRISHNGKPRGQPTPSGNSAQNLKFSEPTSLSERVIIKWYNEVYTRLGNDVLVVLGPRGSGKTGSLLLLLIKALEERDAAANTQKTDMPVPVWISCGSWNPHAVELDEYVAHVLARDYPLRTDRSLGGPGVPKELVAHGHIAVFMDGLDEMSSDRRSKALDRIAEYTKATQTPAVITCRSEEWSEATVGLYPPRSVIELCPVLLRDAEDYLCRNRSTTQTRSWREVFDYAQHHPNSAATKILSSPLGLTLTLRVYSDPVSEHALQPFHLTTLATESEVFDHLYRNFIQLAYSHEPIRRGSMPRRKPFSADLKQCEKSLTFLAKHLQRTHKTDFEWWTLRDSAPRWSSGIFSGSIISLAMGLDLFGVGIGIGVGLLAGFVIALIFRRLFGASGLTYSAGISSGILGGAVGGIAAWTAFKMGIGPLGSFGGGDFCAYLPGPLAIGIGVGVLGGVRGGFLGGLTGGFISSYVGDPLSRYGSVSGILDGLFNGIAYGFVSGAVLEISQRKNPATAMKWSNSGVPVGIIGATAVLTTGSLYGGFKAGILLALVTGIAAAVSNGYVADPEGMLAADPYSVLVRDRKTFLVVSISAGFCLWMATAAVHARATGVLNWFTGAAWLGFFQATWGSFSVARIWLACRGSLPWQVMAFLEDATDREILQQVGAVYRFRNVELQEHLCRRSMLP